MFQDIDMQDIACLAWGFGKAELASCEGFLKVLVQTRGYIRVLAAIHIYQPGSVRVVRQAQAALMKSCQFCGLGRLLVYAAWPKQA